MQENGGQNMKAVVFHAIGDIRLEDVEEPKIQERTDAIVRLTTSAICGTDLHMIRGTLRKMKNGTILGHEGVGIVEEVGNGVRNFRRGDRVIIPSTIACGTCSYCRAGYYAQCDHANPNGPNAGTAFFGGPESSGPFNGLQAELARVPYANIGLVRVPDEVSDDDAILLSDIFPTGYMAADIAEIGAGDTVAVFGCGPVGQFAIVSAMLLGAGRVIAIDRVDSRLDKAREIGAEVVNFEREDPVETIREMTGGIGVDRAIDAVGIDAETATSGPAHSEANKKSDEFREERKTVAPEKHPKGDLWQPGHAPSQVLQWAVDSLAKAGTLSIIGVYSEKLETFPIGKAMNRNLTLQMGNCNHRKYIPMLLDLVQSGAVRPDRVLTQHAPMASIIDAYQHFDQREPGWLKVAVEPSQERHRERVARAEEERPEIR